MPGSGKKRVIIITGASRGLGRALALRFGRAGERVVVNFLSNEQAARAVADGVFQNGGEAILYGANVKNTVEIETMVSYTLERWGSIDVLINNAALTKDRIILRMSEAEWDDVSDANLSGPFHCIRAVTDHMIKQLSGHIINISSIVGEQGREGQANYAAAKAGLIGLTKAAAKELGLFNIQVNAVLPGYLPTEMGATISNDMHNRILRENTLGRGTDADEVAELIYQLSLTHNVSGQVFNLDSRIL
jgi:3-oxoacyl-[acyl-carrier protein] reductase